MGTSTQELLPLGRITFEMSPTIGQLVDALAKARKVFKPVVKESVNPFFKSKYADLAAVIEATKDGLSDNSLVVIQPPVYGRDGAVQIITLLAHSSGEWIKSILDMPVSKTDAQGVGSAITYGRRYAYSATVNVASEEDDDANAAVSKPFKKAEKPPETDEEFDQRTAGERCISPEQITEIDKALKRTGRTEEEIIAALAFIGEKRIEHIKRNQFDKFLKWANGAKKETTTADDLPRKKAMAALFAAAAEHEVPEKDLKQLSYERFHVKSMTELTVKQLVEAREWIESVAAQHAEAAQ